MSKIVMSVTKDETRMALLENGRLAEYVVERDAGAHLVGSIYKGKVSHLLQGIQAAFIDIGLSQNAFLYQGGKPLTEGETVLVQITKDVRGNKGPTATRNITLPGKFVVLLLNAKYVGLSRKINDLKERKRLEELCKKLCPKDLGIVVRTSAIGVAEELLRQDIDELVEQYRILQARNKVAKAPALLHRELDLAIRVVRDYISMNIDEIIVDDEAAFERLKEFLANLPVQPPMLKLHKGEEIFAYYQLQEQVLAITDRQVPLPSGGTLVIDYTEAMTVIDVNSGKFNSNGSMEDTILATNREAAVEIAHQLRLRDIGGIIVVDFIDMRKDAQKLEIMSILQTALEGDRMRPKVQDITVLNLVEITRKKSRQNLSAVLYTDCPVCNGIGIIRSKDTLVLEIKRKLRHALMNKGSKNILLNVNPWLEECFKGHLLKDWEKELGCTLNVEFKTNLHPETYQVLDNNVDN